MLRAGCSVPAARRAGAAACHPLGQHLGPAGAPTPACSPVTLVRRNWGKKLSNGDFLLGGSGDWHCLWGGSGVSASQGLPTARGTRCPPFTPSASQGCPQGCSCPYGGVGAPGLEEAAVALLPVPGAVSGKGRVVRALRLPAWQRNATRSCQRDAVAGRGLRRFPRLGAKPGSPRACSRGQIYPLKPLAAGGASVPLGCPYEGHLCGPPSVGGFARPEAFIACDCESPAGLGQGLGSAGGTDGAVPCPSSTGSSDPYCIVKIDDEAIIR